MSSAAELWFNTMSVGRCWVLSPKLKKHISLFWIPTTIPTNSASQLDSAVTLGIPDLQEIKFCPFKTVTPSWLLPPPGASEASDTVGSELASFCGTLTKH
eukprot:2475206-Prorocentrum_lima.AAC.1